jgi:hypothetical protein
MYPLNAFRQRGLINGLNNMNLFNTLLVTKFNIKDLIEVSMFL